MFPMELAAKDCMPVTSEPAKAEPGRVGMDMVRPEPLPDPIGDANPPPPLLVLVPGMGEER